MFCERNGDLNASYHYYGWWSIIWGIIYHYFLHIFLHVNNKVCFCFTLWMVFFNILFGIDAVVIILSLALQKPCVLRIVFVFLISFFRRLREDDSNAPWLSRSLSTHLKYLLIGLMWLVLGKANFLQFLLFGFVLQIRIRFLSFIGCV